METITNPFNNNNNNHHETVSGVRATYYHKIHMGSKPYLAEGRGANTFFKLMLQDRTLQHCTVGIMQLKFPLLY